MMGGEEKSSHDQLQEAKEQEEEDESSNVDETPPHKNNNDHQYKAGGERDATPVPRDKRRLFVGNLIDPDMSEEILNTALQKYGNIESIHFVKGKFAFVTYEDPSSVESALQDQEQTEFDIRPAKERREESSRVGTKKTKKPRKPKRPKDGRPEASTKICFEYIRDGKCRDHDNNRCRFSHDLPAYMATRPDDIQTLDGVCPLFENFGYCKFGAMCRLGKGHIDPITGTNIVKPRKKDGDDNSNKMTTLEDQSALLPIDARRKLRKRRYVFQYEIRKNQQKHEQQEHGCKPVPIPTTSASLDRPALAAESRIKKIIDFSNKVYVAPLTTVGNLPFRRIMKKFGADITCGEMALCSSLLQGNLSEWALLKRHESEDVFGIQLAAGHPDHFLKVAELLETHCPNKIDFVDINMGCPIDLICNKGAGAALMMRGNERRGGNYFKDILEGMTNTLSCPVTLKMRTGWDMNRPIAHEFVPKIQGWGISSGLGAVMIHGRSRQQRYQRPADWDYIDKVALCQSDENSNKLPVIGNGDIFSYADYEDKVLSRVRDGSDSDGGSMLSPTAMLGRGALIKPWLPTEIKEQRNWDISASERFDILKDFVRFGLEHWGSDQQGLNNTRRYLLEWLSFLYRYIPIGLLEQHQQDKICNSNLADVVPQQQRMNQRMDRSILVGRSELETLFLSSDSDDWIKISELLLGPVPEGFQFEPKHKAKS